MVSADSSSQFETCVRLYEMGEISAGTAAQRAGVPKPYFLSRLGDYGVYTFDLTEEELVHDFKNA